jgi:hypothetical protein
MNALERLAFDSATALLNYLQYSYWSQENAKCYLTADTLAGTLCEVLTELDSVYPGVTEGYGWTCHTPLSAMDSAFEEKAILEGDAHRW